MSFLTVNKKAEIIMAKKINKCKQKGVFYRQGDVVKYEYNYEICSIARVI